ncbi:hypothetical protein [Rhodococcus opacus]|uniref:hypothetical protein n=1 Tax=Rhodococcus opacus TaxID=37919 RepID=UPI001C436991|nr:hypothetical protein [Rhodococcus opacus]MBV6758390.1 hypothetical protein [Rhodococcus opacus]
MPPRARKTPPNTYQARPLEVRAAQFVLDETGQHGNAAELQDVLDPSGGFLSIRTFRGEFAGGHLVSDTEQPFQPGDWIVHYPNGSVEVLDEPTFATRFEAVQ